MTHVDDGVVEIDGGQISWEAAGEGPAVAFLHPGLWDRRTWDEQFDTFSETFRVVRYDARGYGKSSRPEPGRPYSHVGDLFGVLDAAGADRAALVGCSMGAATAIDAALMYPDRVTALVLAGAGINGDFDLTADEETELERLNLPVEHAMEAGDLDRAQDARLRIWAPLGTDDPAGGKIRKIAFDNLHELTMDESARRDISPPAIERLEHIASPTLILPADHDPLAYQRVSAVLAEAIPKAQLVQIPDVDHVVNMRKPAEFDALVLAFLRLVL